MTGPRLPTWTTIALLAAGALALTGCAKGSVQEVLGIDKRAPDEFSVVSRAPLIMPPDYQLRPPQPGAPRPGVGTSADQARASLTGQSTAQATEQALVSIPANAPAQAGVAAGVARTAPVANAAPATMTAGQTALLAEATAGAPTDPAVRTKIAEENQRLAQVEAAFFTKLMNWRQPATLGTTVDAQAEAERLRTAKAEGKPATASDTPMVVQRRQSALRELLGNVF